SDRPRADSLAVCVRGRPPAERTRRDVWRPRRPSASFRTGAASRGMADWVSPDGGRGRPRPRAFRRVRAGASLPRSSPRRDCARRRQVGPGRADVVGEFGLVTGRDDPDLTLAEPDGPSGGERMAKRELMRESELSGEINRVYT